MFLNRIPWNKALSGGFNPAVDLPNVYLWYDASDESSISDTGGLVDQWNEKAVGTYHAVKQIDGDRPTTGSVTQNGLNGITFDNTDVLINLAINSHYPRSCIWVASHLESPFGNYDSVISGIPGANPNVLISGQGASNGFWDGAGTQYGTTDGTFYVNGLETTTFLPATTPKIAVGIRSGAALAADDICIGRLRNDASRVWNGTIFEIIVASSSWSDADRIAAQNYLAEKWALTI